MVCYARSQTRRFVEQSRWRKDDIIRSKLASCIQGNESFIQRTSEKHRRWKNIEKLQRGLDDGRAFLLCSIMSVHHLRIYGATADWCQDLAQRIVAHSPRSTGNPSCKCGQWLRVSSPIRGSIELYQTTNVQHGSRTKLGAAVQRDIRTSQNFFNYWKLAMTLVL